MIHLYAVADGPLPVGLRGIDDAPVTSLASGVVHAVVSQHDTPVPRTAAAALAHATVVGSVTQQVRSLPVRFGSDHRDEAGLHDRLASEVGLRERLERVADKVEFVVRAEGGPAERRPAGPTATPGSGRAYLEARRDEQRRAEDVQAACWRHLEVVTAPLVPLAASVADTVGRAGPERCFLVARGDSDAFLRRASARVDGSGLLVGGPWPPFTFASAPATEEAVR